MSKRLVIVILLLILLFLTFLYCKCHLLPAAKIILKPLTISVTAPITETEPHTVFEAVLNGANFAIVYISILLAITAILITVMCFWWEKKLSILEKCNQDYEIFKENSSRQAYLITAKIFVIDERFSEAWEQIKDLPENLNYEVPLYKAKILMGQPHDEYVFPAVMKLLSRALLFPTITSETKSIIFREMSRVYFQEKRDYKKALEYAEHAIKEDYTHWSAYNARALALRHLGNLDEAITVLEECIKGNNKYDAGFYNLSCYYAQKMERERDGVKKLNLKDMAVSNYKAAIRLQPKNKEYSRTDPDLSPIRKEIRDL